MRYRVTPVISTTALTCATTVGSNIIESSAQFGSVVAGMRIVGAGVPFNSIVEAVTDDSTLTIINAETKSDALATATAASVSLRFGYFTSLAYASGDVLGFPFRVPMTIIRNAIIIDAVKQITKARLYFFSKPFTEIADNAAFAPSDADATNLCGYISLTTSIVLTSNQIVTQAVTALPVDVGGDCWCQLVVDTDTPTFTAVNNLTVLLAGE